MKKWLRKNWKIGLILIAGMMVIRISECGVIFKTVSWWIILGVLVLFALAVLVRRRYIWFFLLVLIPLGLILNDLLFIKLNPWGFSVDVEQSFWEYSGVSGSIDRYLAEGLFLPFRLRMVFYSDYLKIFSWLINFSKLLSVSFWLHVLGFTGSYLMFTGLVNYFKDKRRNSNILVWFILVMATSACRALGDSSEFIFLALPVIFYWIYQGIDLAEFKRKKWLIIGLLILDWLLL